MTESTTSGAKRTISRTLIFVGGCFGVGKSTLCRELAPLLQAEHLKASDLVQFQPDSRDSTSKVTDRAIENQEQLIHALHARPNPRQSVILDGHYCLLDSSHSVIPLPPDVFERIGAVATVLVEASAAHIVERLTLRDGSHFQLSVVEALLRTEREHAQVVARKLGVPLFYADASTAASQLAKEIRLLKEGQ